MVYLVVFLTAIGLAVVAWIIQRALPKKQNDALDLMNKRTPDRGRAARKKRSGKPPPVGIVVQASSDATSATVPSRMAVALI